MLSVRGFTDARTRLFQSRVRGIGDGLAIRPWLNEFLWPCALYLDTEDARTAAQLGAVEAARAGITTVIDHHYAPSDPARSPGWPRGGLLVLDLGVHERYGNQVFLDSGLLRTFRQIADDRIGAPAPAWRDGYFHGAHRTGTELIADRVEELPVSGERPSRAVWETDYFRSAAEPHLATTGTLVPRQTPPSPAVGRSTGRSRRR
ncbi:DUF6716 putative glycosyltransferase [Streptomyces sp. NPDC058373]|uniref:DUF6716 putative glycosyltransferase n=1 Tax=Streptomyces sp. NPDC058373 TaxID=3346465 RepID=UPI0036627E43